MGDWWQNDGKCGKLIHRNCGKQKDHFESCLKNWWLSTPDVDNLVENCAELHIICLNREGMILIFNAQVSQEPVYTQDFSGADG